MVWPAPGHTAPGTGQATYLTGVKALFGSLLILEHFEDVLKTQNVKSVSDLRNQAADFDVPADLTDFLDEAHKDSQSCRRDVTQFGAVHDDAVTAGFDLGLNGVLEFRRGVRI